MVVNVHSVSSPGLWKTVSYSSKKLMKMWRGSRRKPSVSQTSWSCLLTRNKSLSISEIIDIHPLIFTLTNSDWKNHTSLTLSHCAASMNGIRCLNIVEPHVQLPFIVQFIEVVEKKGVDISPGWLNYCWHLMVLQTGPFRIMTAVTGGELLNQLSVEPRHYISVSMSSTSTVKKRRGCLLPSFEVCNC